MARQCQLRFGCAMARKKAFSNSWPVRRSRASRVRWGAEQMNVAASSRPSHRVLDIGSAVQVPGVREDLTCEPFKATAASGVLPTGAMIAGGLPVVPPITDRIQTDSSGYFVRSPPLI